MEIVSLLTSLTSQPLAQSLAWLLSVTGALDRLLSGSQGYPSGAPPNAATTISPAGIPELTVSATDVTVYLLSRRVLDDEIRLWKGIHSFHPFTIEYANEVNQEINAHRDLDVTLLSSRVQMKIEEIRASYHGAAPRFAECRNKLVTDALVPMLNRVESLYKQQSNPDQAVLDAIAQLRTQRGLEAPNEWNQALGLVLDAVNRWTPPTPPINGGHITNLPKIDGYLRGTMNTIAVAILYTSRFLTADKFLNPGGVTPTVDIHLQANRSPFIHAVANGLGRDLGGELVVLSNARILDCLDLLAAGDPRQ